MDVLEVTARRLRNQLLTHGAPGDPVAVVAHLGAVQAQEYAVAKWSVGQRAPGLDDAAVQRAVDEGAIVRTHALRPTWHFLAAADVAWIQALTGPRVKQLSAYYFRQAGLDESTMVKAAALIGAMLRGGNHLTRKEIGAELARAGVQVPSLQLGHLVMRAELDGLIGNGPMRGKQHTYALLSERIPAAPPRSPDEALAELTLRYFTSHGPATVKDFAWWSSLTRTQIKRGLELVGPALVPTPVDGLTMWYAPADPPPAVRSPRVHALPSYDEYMVAYTESRHLANVESRRAAVANENTLVHGIVLDGQIVGVWRRVVEPGSILVQPAPAKRLTAAQRRAVEEEFGRYADFTGVPVVLEWPRA